MLPTSLLLLIHLHLLNFPSTDALNYDEKLFDPKTRGIRERVSTMEDVSYFLVGKVEGYISAKKVRGQYND